MGANPTMAISEGEYTVMLAPLLGNLWLTMTYTNQLPTFSRLTPQVQIKTMGLSQIGTWRPPRHAYSHRN
jgi:hypothetical protein